MCVHLQILVMNGLHVGLENLSTHVHNVPPQCPSATIARAKFTTKVYISCVVDGL